MSDWKSRTEEVLTLINEVTRPPYAGSSIGASVIGDDCDALISLQYRGVTDGGISSKQIRTFRLGDAIEDLVVYGLRQAGYHVLDRDPATRKQFTYRDLGGFVVSKVDGHIMGEDWPEAILLEIKSMNNARWGKFSREGVKKSDPKYFAQAQASMGLSGFNFCLIVSMNKNTSEIAVELVEFDQIEWAFLRERAERVLRGSTKRTSKKRDDWRCKWCFKSAPCWGEVPLPKTCKTCVHGDSNIRAGEWQCRAGEEFGRVCEKHEYIKIEEK